MKNLKIYDDLHTDVKVMAAQTGRTTTNVGSEILRIGLEAIRKGSAKLSDSATLETTPATSR